MKSSQILFLLFIIFSQCIYCQNFENISEKSTTKSSKEPGSAHNSFHLFDIGINLQIPPSNNYVTVDQSLVDPSVANLSAYEINMSVGFKSGYTFYAKLYNQIHYGIGVNFSQRIYNFTYFGDSLVSSGVISNFYTNGSQKVYNLELAPIIRYQKNRIGVDFGSRIPLIDYRKTTNYKEDNSISQYKKFTAFDRIQSEYLIWPFISFDYRVFQNSEFQMHLSSALEIRKYTGHLLTISIKIRRL